MANYFRQDNTAASVKLPIKWLAIESIHNGVFSEKTDVVSQNRNINATCYNESHNKYYIICSGLMEY